MPLAVTYAEGTHRVATPRETLQRITPHLGAMGITRLADITGLDRIGIPTWCSIRPRGVLLQVSNGKGTSHDSAKVSALMEAIELWHAENPAIAFRRASAEELRREAEAFLPVEGLPDWRAEVHLTERRVIDWVRGEARLISSAISNWVKTGPRMKRKPRAPGDPALPPIHRPVATSSFPPSAWPLARL